MFVLVISGFSVADLGGDWRQAQNTTPHLEEEDARRLLHAPDTGTLIGCRDYALLFAYFKTWLRRSALANATIGCLEPGAEWQIRVTEKRNKKVRRLLLEATQPVIDWIERSGRTLDDKHLPLFPAIAPYKLTVTDRPLAGRTILQMVKKYGKQIGLNVSPSEGRGICTHTLRKSSGVSALKNGSDMWQVKEQFGHSSRTFAFHPKFSCEISLQ